MQKQQIPKDQPQKRQLLKIVLSVFIIAHLSVIIILANGASYLGRRLEGLLIPYANTLGLNASWNFFSPDPVNTFYFKYSVRFLDENGNDLKERVEGFLPENKEEPVHDSGKKRYVYATRIFGFDEKNVRYLLGPYFCRQYPGATEVAMQSVIRPIPPLDTAIMRPDQIVQEVKSENYLHNCNQTQDEVAL